MNTFSILIPYFCLMKKCLTIIFLLYNILSFSQAINDTANVPYYVGMMQNKNVNFFATVKAANLYWTGRDSSKKGCGWKAYKRWEWEMRQIIKPDGTYPDMQKWINDYYKAANLGLNNNNIQQGGIGGSGLGPCKTKGDWKELGPGFLPYNRTTQPGGVGRLNAVAFHPTDSNILWVCAPAGGLWKSINGGSTWSSNTDSLPTLGISALVMSSRNPDTMYIGTGDRDHGDATGLGVYMSANGGKSWISRNSGMSTITIARLIIHPTDTRILLAATANGIYRTTNSGSSWSQIVTGSFKDIVFNPLNPNTVFATKDGLFYRSTNCGLTFSQITSGLPSSGLYRGAIAVTAADTSYVYFLICDFTKYYGTYLSTNGGSSFSVKSTTPNVMDYSTNGSGTGGQAWYDLDVACDPTNRDVFFVGGVNIFKSTDAGATWTISAHWIGSNTIPSIHADQHNLEFNPITKKLYAVNDGGVFYTPNKGTKWIDLSNGIGVSQLYKIGKSTVTKDLLIGGFQDNGTSYFSGEEWNGVRGGDGMDCEWDNQDENYSYGALYYGNITRFYKGSQDLTVANNGVGSINETGDWVTPYCLRPDNTNTMFVGYKNIWRNTAVKSGSMSWTNITNNGNGNNIREVEVSYAKPDIIYYSRYDNKFFRCYKGTGSAAWVDLTSNLPATGTVSAIKCHPTDSNTVYIGLNGKFYRSRNRGVSWTDLSSGLPNNTVNCISLDTSNTKFGIYVGTYTGVWYKDSSSTFSTFNSGIPINGSVTDLDIFYDKRGKPFYRLYAATFSRGTWKSALYDDGSLKPKTDFGVKLPKTCNDKTYTLTPDCGYNPSRFKWLITPSSYAYQKGTDSLSEVLKVKFTKPGYYNVRLATENCNGSDTLTKQNFIVSFDTVATSVSCKTTTTNLGTNNGLGITNVELNGLSNESSGAYDEGSYMDFSCKKVFFLKPGNKYFTKITTSPFYSEYVKIYIDYNNNGTLNDAGEEVYSSYKLSNHADTIRCPSTMTKNKVLRMRVVSDFNSIGGPCATLSYGQSEDYGVFFDEPIPKFTVSKDTVCANTSVIVSDATVGIGYNYTWSFGSGASPSTGSGTGPFNIKYSSSGYKKISMTINGNLSKSKDSAVLVLLTPSTSIFLKKGKLIQCEKDSITLAARDKNKTAFIYQWQKTNANISGSTDTLMKLWNNISSVSGNYRVISSNGACKDTSANVAVLINPMPKVGFTVNNLNQCFKGNKFIITDTTKLSTGSYKALYTYSNGSTDTNKTHAKIFASVNSFTLKQRITTNQGCKDSVSKTLTVYPNTSVGFNINDSDQCKNGNSFTFTNTSSLSAGTYSNNWIYGNGNTATSTNGSQSYASYGTYNVSLITTTNNNCKDTLTKKAYVFASPIAKYAYNDSDQCLKGNNFAFTNTSTIAAGSNTYAWSFGDNTTSSSTSPSKKYSSVNSFTVKLKAISNNNCTDSISKLMLVYPNTSVNFNINDTAQCKNTNSFSFTNTSTLSAGTFTNQWQYGNGNTSSSSNGSQSYASYGIYFVSLITTTNNACKDTLTKRAAVYASPLAKFSVNDSDQCLKGHQFNFTNVTIIGSGTNTYLWKFGDNSSSTQTNPSKKYGTYNTFKVKLEATSDHGCIDSISKLVIVYENSAIAFSINDSDQCLNGNQFKYNNMSTLATGLYSSFWQYGNGNTANTPNGVQTYFTSGTFNVRLVTTTNNNCKDTLDKKIMVWAKPNLAYNVNDSDQCLRGNKFNFTNNSSIISGTQNFVWSFGDNTNSTITSPSKIYSNYNTYKVQLKGISNFGCSDSITKKVYVFAMPKSGFAINDSSQCLPINNFSFVSNASVPTGTYSSQWNFGDGNNSGSPSPSHGYATSGLYSVTQIVVSNNNCNDTITKSLEVYKKPSAAFTALPTSQCLNGNTVNLTNNTVSAKTYTTLFDMGDGNTVTTNNFKYHYLSAGAYKILLTVKIKTGCEDTLSQVVNIYPSPKATYNVNTSNACLKNNNIITTNNSTPAGINYRWYYGDGDSSKAIQSNHQYKNTGTYKLRLIVTNGNNCNDTANKNITINAVPKATFNINDSTQCLNINSFVFNNTSSISSGSINASWTFGDAGNSALQSPTHRYSNSGKFKVRLIANSVQNCSDTLIKNIEVYAKPDATYTITTISAKVREFTAVVNTYVKYVWTFGDGNIGDSAKKSHTYNITNSYNTSLVVTDNNGCTDTSKQTYQYTSDLQKVISNANRASVYPNPTAGLAQIHFELAQDGFVKYHIYDINGKLIFSMTKESLSAGVYDFFFDFVKTELAAGTYFFELETKTGKTTEKVIFNK